MAKNTPSASAPSIPATNAASSVDVNKAVAPAGRQGLPAQSVGVPAPAKAAVLPSGKKGKRADELDAMQAGDATSAPAQGAMTDAAELAASDTAQLDALASTSGSSAESFQLAQAASGTAAAEAAASTTVPAAAGGAASVATAAAATSLAWAVPAALLGVAAATSSSGSASAPPAAPPVTADTTAPTLVISSNKTALKAGETATITFTFSEDPGTSFAWDGSTGDVVVAGGTLSAISGSGLTRTATFTPTAGLASGSASITVAAGNYADAAGNVGAAGVTPTITLDTLAPAAPILALGAGVSNGATSAEAGVGAVSVTADSGATVVVTFARGGQTVTKTLTGTGAAQAVSLTTAELTALGSGTIQVSATQTDAAGNAQSAPAATTSFTLDTVLPTVADTGMVVTRASRTIELTFSENLEALDLTEAAFAVTTVIGAGPQSNTVVSVTVSGNKVTLLLASAFEAGQVNVTYTAPGATSTDVGLQDVAGNKAQGFFSGKVADGYIRGASIFIELANGTLFDTGVKTNASGDFFLPAGTPAGAIVATGGVNIDTGVPNNVALKAPEGATTINPLTTMVQAVMASSTDKSLTSAAASMTVAAALGLPLELDLNSYDPISAGAAGGNDPVALAVQKAAAQVATLVSLAGGSTTVIDNLVGQITGAAEAGGSVDLSDSSTLNSALSGLTLTPTLQASMADAMNVIASSSSMNGIVSAQAQVLDRTAPTAPTVTVTAVTNDTTPEVRVALDVTSVLGGAAVVGDTVVLLVDGAQVASLQLTAADIAQGYATVSLPELSAGEHQVSARQIDLAGNASGTSSPAALLIDTVAPTASLVSGSVNAQGSAQVQSSEAGRAYLVHESLVVEGMTEADLRAAEDGLWNQVTVAAGNTVTAVAASGLVDGRYQLVTVDAAGNLGQATTNVLTVDNQAPLAAVGITAVDDNVDPTKGAVPSGGATNDNTLALSGILVGSRAAGEVVQVYDGATLLGQATVNDTDGTWTFLTPSLANGAHSLTARMVDAAGNLGQASSAHTLTVDASVPTGIASIGSATPRATADTTPVISGTVSGTIGAGDLVAIYDGRTLLGTVEASAQWSFTVTSALSEGPHQITAVVQNVGGNQGTPSSAYALTVDTVAPTVTVLTDDTALNVGDSAALTFIFSEAPTFESGQTPVTASNGATITNWAAKADSGGRVYTATLNAPTAEVTGNISVSLTPWADAAGNAGTTASSPTIAVDTAAPSAPVVGTSFGSSINLAEKVAGASIEVTANAGDIVKLSLGSNTVVLGTGNATYGAGKWVYALTANDYASIGKNPIDVKATATDAAGNASPASVVVPISADTVAPLLTPVSVTGVTAGNNRINTSTPSVSFTAEVGATLAVDWTGSGTYQAVTSGTGVDGSGVVQGTANGSAAVVLTSANAIGTNGQANTVTVRATDDAGNITYRSAGYVLDNTALTGRAIVVSQDGSQVTLAFSESVAVAGLTASSITLNNGHSLGTNPTIAAVSPVGGRATTFVVTLGAGATMAADDTLSIDNDVLADLASNKPGADISFTVPAFDATPAALRIGADKLVLKQGESAQLSFTFSEPVVGFDRSDITVTPAGVLGTLSAPQRNADGGVTYTLSYRPLAGTSADVTIAVDASRYADLVGNVGTGSNAMTLRVDTLPPKVAITSSSAALKADEAAELTFTFNEAPASLPTVTPVVNAGGTSAAGTPLVLTRVGTTDVYKASFTPAADMPAAKVNFTVGTWADAAGNVGLTEAAPLIEVDTRAPKLTISAGRSSLNSQADSTPVELLFTEAPVSLPTLTPSLSGATLSALVRDSANPLRYTATLSAPASATGTLTFAVTDWTDRAGNAGTVQASPTLSVDTQAPTAQASITAVTYGEANTAVLAGSQTNQQLLKLSGTVTGTLGSDSLAVYDGTTRLGVASVTDGGWTFTMSNPLGNGGHAFTVRAEDAARNAGPASAAFAVNVNADIPSATAAILSAVDNQGAVVGALSSGAITDDATPTLVGSITGVLKSGEKVVVFKNGAYLGDATVTGGTSWKYDVADAAGAHSYSVAVEGAGGAKGVMSAAFSLATDLANPSLTITSNKAALKAGESAVLTFTFSEAVVGFTKADITGVRQEDLGSLAGPVLAANGAVSYTVDYRPAAGIAGPEQSPQVAQGSYTDRVGNAGQAGALALRVDTQAPLAPTINSLAAINAAAVTAGVDVTGTATGASSVALSLGSLVRNLAVTNGSWTYRLTSDDYAQLGQRSGVTLTARSVDAAGNLSTSAGTATVSVDTIAPVLNINGPIAGDGYLNNAEDEQSLTLSGTAVDLVDGSVINLRVGTLTGLSTTLSNNSWSLTLNATQLKSLPQGALEVVATTAATDAALNPAGEARRNLNYDNVAPDAPVITAISDDTGVAGDRITNDNTPTLTVAAPGAAKLVLFTNGQPVSASAYTVTAGTEGSFTVTASNALANGAYQVLALDAAGNPSASGTVTQTFRIDRTAPTVQDVNLTSSNAQAGVVLAGDTVTLTFRTNEALSGSPQVSLLGQAVTPVAGASGLWTATRVVQAADALGTVSFSIQATDVAGNPLPQAVTAQPAGQQGLTVLSQAPSTATYINWVTDRSSPILQSDDVIFILVHFTNAVAVDTAGGLPSLGLTIVDEAGIAHPVQAVYRPGPQSTGHTLTFVYERTDPHVGQYHINTGSIALNGATMLEALPGASGPGQPANLTLSAANLPVTAGSYLYGEPVFDPAAVTAGSDLVAVFDASIAAAGQVPASGAYTGISGGAGNRDLLSVPVLLPSSVTSESEALDYSLHLDMANQVVQLRDSAGETVKTVSAVFPTGIEIMAFHMVYAVGTELEYTETDPFVLFAALLQSTDPVALNEFHRQGTVAPETIDVSADTSTSSRYVLRGGAGNDTITGHAGSDYIHGDAGNDVINAGGGNDRIFVGSGSDSIDGGSGTDTLVLSVSGRSMALVSRLSGPAIAGVDGTDVDNMYRLSVEDSGALVVKDFDTQSTLATAVGMERLEIRPEESDTRDAFALNRGTSGNDTVAASGQGLSILAGLAGDDTLTASNGGDVLLGGSGDDSLIGGSSRDLLYGGAGIDVLNGGGGNDFLVGNEGSDSLDGGEGSDEAGFLVGVSDLSGGTTFAKVYDAATTSVHIKLGTLTLAKITQGMNGSLVIADQNSTLANLPSFGVDTVKSVEKFNFDYTGRSGGNAYNVTLSEINALFSSAPTGPTQPTEPTEPTQPQSFTGTVVDGYVSGATVFYDLDGDNIKDSNEVSASTDEDGRFTVVLPSAQGRWVVQAGGLDEFSSVPLISAMSAATGSTVISPLTTLLTTASSYQAQMNKLVSVFGMQGLLTAANISDLGKFDPLAALGDSSPAKASAGAAVFAAQQAVMTVMQMAERAKPAGWGSVAAKINTAIDEIHGAGGTFTLQTTALAIVDKVSKSVMQEVVGQPLGVPAAQVTALVDQLAAQMAGPVKAVTTALLSNFNAVGTNFKQGFDDLEAGFDSSAANAVKLAQASIFVAQKALLDQVGAIVAAGPTNPTQSGNLASSFVSGLTQRITQAAAALNADGPLLNQSFLKVAAGSAAAFATLNTPEEGDDVTGTYTLTGSEKVALFASQTVGSDPLTSAQEGLVKALKSATSPQDFATKLAAAVAAGVTIDFGVVLGNGVDLDGDGTPDAGAVVQLVSQPLALGASVFNLAPGLPQGNDSSSGSADLPPHLAFSWDHGSSFLNRDDDELVITANDLENPSALPTLTIKPLVWSANITATPTTVGLVTSFEGLNLQVNSRYEVIVDMADGTRWGFKGGDAVDAAGLVAQMQADPNYSSRPFTVGVVGEKFTITDKSDATALTSASVVYQVMEVAQALQADITLDPSVVVNGAIARPALQAELQAKSLSDVVGLRITATETEDTDATVLESTTRDFAFPSRPVSVSGPQSITEGTQATYGVQLNRAAPEGGITLAWKLVPAFGVTSLNAADFGDGTASALPGGTFTIAAGQRTASFQVSARSDGQAETNGENLLVQIGHGDSFLVDAELQVTLKDAAATVSPPAGNDSPSGPGGDSLSGSGNDSSAGAGNDTSPGSGNDTSSGGGDPEEQDPNQGPVLATMNGAVVADGKVVATFAEALSADTVLPDRFAVWVNGTKVPVSTVELAGAVVTLTTVPPIPAFADVYFTYTDPNPYGVNDGAGVLQALDGRDVPTLGGTPVVNGVGGFEGNDDKAPALLTVTENAGTYPWVFIQESQLHIQFTESLAGTLPAASAFKVNLGGTAEGDVDVLSLALRDGNDSILVLTLDTAITEQQLDTAQLSVKYTIPSSNPLQDAAGNLVGDGNLGLSMSFGTPTADTQAATPTLDVLTGWEGNDHFVFAQGTGSAVTGPVGSLYTLPNGVDRVLDFRLGDVLDLPNLAAQTSGSTLADQSYRVFRGSYDVNENTFNATGTGAQALVVFDGNAVLSTPFAQPSAYLSPSAVLLNLASSSTQLSLATGSLSVLGS